MKPGENIHPIFEKQLSSQEREKCLNQRSGVFWFTGLSGSGKSTIAAQVERVLAQNGFAVYLLDGDNICSGLNKNLSFTVEDRTENIRRISEVAKLFNDAGLICLCSFISPTDEIRDRAKEIIGDDHFNLIFVNTPLEVCEERDVKGLYAKARKGELPNFTGIDSPFEAPKETFFTIETTKHSIEESVSLVTKHILKKVKLV